MDFFGTAKYFSTHIPHEAQRHPMLKHALCAYAALHLARSGRKHELPNRISAFHTHTAGTDGVVIDWERESSFHHDQLTSLLGETMLRRSIPISRNNEYPAAAHSVLDKDFTALAILFEYELFKNPQDRKHRLLNLLKMTAFPPNTQHNTFSGTGKQAFWDIARTDYMEACKPSNSQHL